MIFQHYLSSFILSKLIKLNAIKYYLYLVYQYLIHMSDYQEITSLQQAIEEIRRRDKTVANLRQIGKTHQNHLDVFRRRVAELEARRNTATTQEDPRIQELNKSLARANAELEQKQRDNDRLRQANKANEHTQRENFRLNEMMERLRKEISELKQPPKGQQAPNMEVQQLKTENQKLRQERQKQQSQIRSLQLELKSLEDKGKSASERLEKQLKQKQKKIAEYEKKISNLEKSNRSFIEQQRKSQVMEQKEPFKHEELVQTVTQSSKIDFFQGVPLTESLNQDHLIIPTTHSKIFSLLDTYLSRLMPQHQVKFLNLIIADSENKLDRVSDFLQISSE